MIRSLSVSEWHVMVKEGNAPPVRIRLAGNSMFPMIRKNRDYVTVVPPGETMQAGDIVMFMNPDKKRYVMHRVWSIKEGMVLTWGDNCHNPDGWIPVENILGKTALIERGNRTIHPDPEKGRRWAAFWHQAGKVYRFARRIKNGVRRRITKSG